MSWTFDRIIDRYTDGAGKVRVRILLTDGQDQRCEHLKFDAVPDAAAVRAVVTDLLSMLNQPDDPPDLERIRLEIAVLKVLKAALEDENKSLKDELAKLKDKQPQ
ncbi:MAG: hypothetical protein ACM359_10680 [Bacillota bacterium]